VIKSFRKIKASKPYNHEELFDLIKDKPFIAGIPELSGKGLFKTINFPAIGRHQVQIKCSKSKIMIIAGEDRSQFAKNLGMNTAIRGMSDVADTLSSDRKQVINQVGITASELAAMDL